MDKIDNGYEYDFFFFNLDKCSMKHGGTMQ